MANFKKSISNPLLTTLVFASFLFACQEEETLTSSSNETNDQLITDESIADDLFEDIDDITMEAASFATNGRLESEGVTSENCVTRTVETNQDLSRTVTLSFEGECQGPKGRTRTGSLIINRSIDLEASTYTSSTSFQDFYINGRKIEGIRTLEYTSDDKNIITVNVSLIGGKVTLEDGSVITREGNFTRIIDRENGKITMTGSASGVNRFGSEYVSEITSKLVFDKDCASEGIYMPAQGIKLISRANKSDVQVDYGDGICDKTVTLSAEGEKRNIELSITKK